MQEMIIRKPDDMHVHLRSGKMLRDVLPYTSKVFSRGVVMGNLQKAVVTADDAEEYQKEILGVDVNFDPIMTIMLTKKTTPQIVEEAFQRGIKVLKYIPGNASNNSEEGVDFFELDKFYPVLEMAEKLGMILSGHWEVPFDEYGTYIPELEREVRAICFLDLIIRSFPKLKIVVEHASTRVMIEFIKQKSENVSATLTVHHALLVCYDVLDNEKVCNPHLYCKPVAKHPFDRRSVVEAMVSGNPKFFFGSDSAPHPITAKEKIPPSAGIFTAPVALPLLCEIFEENNALPRLEDFVSRFGAEFYDLPLNQDKIILKKEKWIAPDRIGGVQVFRGDTELQWKVGNL